VSDPRVILYALYVYNEKANAHYEFRLNSLYENIEQDGVPLTRIFGLSREEMIPLLLGLAANHPNFINFTDSKINAELRKLLTEYFEKYKWQKVLNKVDDDFVAELEALANDRQYPFLPSRAEVINELDKTGTFLYWLDAAKSMTLLTTCFRRRGND
jgi:hypothetical protein